MYVTWKCLDCGDIKVSNSHRRHQMDMCGCGRSGLDLEEEYARMCGHYLPIKAYDYNFFDELIICADKQGLKPFIDIGGRLYINLEWGNTVRKMEDEMLEDLK